MNLRYGFYCIICFRYYTIISDNATKMVEGDG